MRTFLQALSLFIFTIFFILANYRLPEWLPADVYLRLDPLLGLSAVLAGRDVISRALWSLIVLGSTVVVGRFFCAYVCPLGATIDFLDLLSSRKKNFTFRQRTSPFNPWRIFWREDRRSKKSSVAPIGQI